MKPADRTPFAETLAACYSLYGKALTPAIIGMWLEAMRPYDLNAVRDALNRHAVNPDTGQYLPKPADVVRLIDGGTADTALLAWAKLERAAQSVGCYESVVFDDAIIHHCVAQMGGWVALCHKPLDEWPFERNRFVTLYRAAAGRRIELDYPRHLVGIAESQNSQGGFAAPTPLLIGDPVRARAVFEGGSHRPAVQVTQFDQVLIEDKAA